MTPSERNRLYGVIHQLVMEQLASEEETDSTSKLASLLADSAEARRVYSEYMIETACLRWCAPTDGGVPPEAPAAPVTFRDWIASNFGQVMMYTFGIALLLSVGAWTISVYFDEPDAGADEVAMSDNVGQNSREVATLIRAIDAPHEEFSRLTIGQTMSLQRGQIELLFDSGVEIVVRGPSSFRITSMTAIYSEHGSFTARVRNGGEGFVVETPSTKIVDLGTAFGVSIRPGDTEVAVFDGIVDLTFGGNDASQRNRLGQGEAVRVNLSGEMQRLGSFDRDQFPTARQSRVTGRDPIITRVSDNIRRGLSNKSYQIVRSGLEEDSPACVDRSHEWNGVDEGGLPQELRSAEYVMPFNDDKFVKDLLVRVGIGRPATIYILMSDTVAMPTWLTSAFEDTGLNVGLDESSSRFKPDLKAEVGPGKSIDTIFSVWKKVVASPRIVTLGQIDDHPDTFDGHNMYAIAAVALTNEE